MQVGFQLHPKNSSAELAVLLVNAGFLFMKELPTRRKSAEGRGRAAPRIHLPTKPEMGGQPGWHAGRPAFLRGFRVAVGLGHPDGTSLSASSAPHEAGTAPVAIQSLDQSARHGEPWEWDQTCCCHREFGDRG